jgi:hypothetical protein
MTVGPDLDAAAARQFAQYAHGCGVHERRVVHEVGRAGPPPVQDLLDLRQQLDVSCARAELGERAPIVLLGVDGDREDGGARHGVLGKGTGGWTRRSQTRLIPPHGEEHGRPAVLARVSVGISRVLVAPAHR